MASCSLQKSHWEIGPENGEPLDPQDLHSILLQCLKALLLALEDAEGWMK